MRRPSVLLLVGILSGLFYSCKKDSEHEKKNLCPVVTTKQVPQAVLDSFISRFLGANVKAWFYKDGSSYCALFDSASVEKLAQFDLEGDFIKEDIENQNDDEQGDGVGNTDTERNQGCECELGNDQGDDDQGDDGQGDNNQGN